MSSDYASGFVRRDAERRMVKTWKANDPRPLHNQTAIIHVELADGRSAFGDDREVMIGVQQQWELHKPTVAWYPLTPAEARELSEHLTAMVDRIEAAEATDRLISGGAA